MKRYIIFWAYVVSESNAMIRYYEKYHNNTDSSLYRNIKHRQQVIRDYAILRLKTASKQD